MESWTHYFPENIKIYCLIYITQTRIVLKKKKNRKAFDLIIKETLHAEHVLHFILIIKYPLCRGCIDFGSFLSNLIYKNSIKQMWHKVMKLWRFVDMLIKEKRTLSKAQTQWRNRTFFFFFQPSRNRGGKNKVNK